NDEKFICRKCTLYYDNPNFKIGQGKRSKDQLNKIITVLCTKCQKTRQMKFSSYTGSLDNESYVQTCGTCAQEGKIIPQEQRDKISETLMGTIRPQEVCDKISKYMKNNLEGIERGKKNLIPGMGGIAR